MEDKKLTPKESMELIASMIQTSKQRVAMSDLRIPTMWATISILTAVAVWVLITTTHNPWFNFIWFAIPVIGLPANILLSAKDRNKKLQKNFYRHSHRRNLESGGLHRHRCYHRVFYCPTVRLSLGLVGHVLLCIYHSRIWSCRDGIAFERELICFRWNILDFLRLCSHYMQSVSNTSLVFLVSVSVYCLFPAYVHYTYDYHHP